MKTSTSMMIIAALLMCSACAEKTSQTSLVANAPLQYSTVVWTDLVSQGQAAQVNNQRLIFQR